MDVRNGQLRENHFSLTKENRFRTCRFVINIQIPVANMLVDWKAEQDEMKEVLGDEYMDYNLVMASTFGLLLGDAGIAQFTGEDDEVMKNSEKIV